MTQLLLVANSGDGTISTLRLHTDDAPRLESVATSSVGDGVNTFAIDAASDLVYAAVKGDPAAVVTLRLDRGTGGLTPFARRDVEAAPAYLALARGGSLLLGASYGGGFGATWPVEAGVLGEPTSRFAHENAHCILPSGEHAYLVALGEDRIAQFRIAGDALEPLDPATVDAPAGSGPRHLVVDGPHAYLSTEFSAEAIRFDVGADGTLTRAEAVRFDDPAAGLPHSDIDKEPPEDRVRWGADVHRAGPWLLCSERTGSTIATITVGDDGRLGQVVALSPTESQPRGFVVAPDGRHVVAVGERSTHAALSRIEDDGSLTLLHREPVGVEANWVRFVDA